MRTYEDELESLPFEVALERLKYMSIRETMPEGDEKKYLTYTRDGVGMAARAILLVAKNVSTSTRNYLKYPYNFLKIFHEELNGAISYDNYNFNVSIPDLPDLDSFEEKDVKVVKEMADTIVSILSNIMGVVNQACGIRLPYAAEVYSTLSSFEKFCEALKG